MDESSFESCEVPTGPEVLKDSEPYEQHQRDGAWAEIERGEGELARRSTAFRELSPTIVALGQRLEQIRSAELKRYRRKLGALEPSQFREVEALTREILNKFLHGSVCELNARAGTPEQEIQLQFVRRTFGLAQ